MLPELWDEVDLSSHFQIPLSVTGWNKCDVVFLERRGLAEAPCPGSMCSSWPSPLPQGCSLAPGPAGSHPAAGRGPARSHCQEPFALSAVLGHWLQSRRPQVRGEAGGARGSGVLLGRSPCRPAGVAMPAPFPFAALGGASGLPSRWREKPGCQAPQGDRFPAEQGWETRGSKAILRRNQMPPPPPRQALKAGNHPSDFIVVSAERSGLGTPCPELSQVVCGEPVSGSVQS